MEMMPIAENAEREKMKSFQSLVKKNSDIVLRGYHNFLQRVIPQYNTNRVYPLPPKLVMENHDI